MSKKSGMKKQEDKLYIHLVDLRSFMMFHDEATLCTGRELAARIANGMITSLATGKERVHKHIAVLGLRDNGISHEGCQKEIVCPAASYMNQVKNVCVREFSDGNGGIFKVNCPIWLQAPFEDEKIISDSLFEVTNEIISKWGKCPVSFVLITKKDGAPDLDAFEEFMSNLVRDMFPQLQWGVVDVSEWKMFDPFNPNR